jgi:hypothetical protein
VLQEPGAVGAADGVHAGEHHHALVAEALAGEAADELRGVGEHGEGRLLSASCFVDTRPSRRPAGTLYVTSPAVSAILSRGEGEDVGAGDGPRALHLHGLLGASINSKPRRLGLFRMASISAGCCSPSGRSAPTRLSHAMVFSGYSIRILITVIVDFLIFYRSSYFFYKNHIFYYNLFYY